MIRTAFVIPWFGRELVGGAEQHIFEVATRLANRGQSIEVLTTCCKSFQEDWGRNHLPEGTSQEGRLTIRRFRVRTRDSRIFDDANRELLGLNERPKAVSVPPVSEETERAFIEENIHSPRLLDYLEKSRTAYESIVFAPYLYGPTLLGLERAGDRAILQPLLHDETYAYLPRVEGLFHKASRILFNSEGEAQLAARLYGPAMWRKGVITGQGVEMAASASPAAESGSDLRLGAYLLYLGRRDSTKNTDLLLRAFRRYRAARSGTTLQLVLAGPGRLPEAHAQDSGIVDLGVVSAERKSTLLANCRALVQPSRNESYSRTMMEAWLHGRPVIVHERCLPTSHAVQISGGGWAADTESDWTEMFAKLESAADAALIERGQAGLVYARERADWDKAVDRYEKALDLRPRHAKRSPSPGQRAIHQMLPSIDYGDAISNQVVFTMEVLRDLGYRSEIMARHIADSMRDVATPFSPGALAPEDGLLYHHAIGSEITPYAVEHRGPKALLYHNITPAPFFEPWDPQFARFLETGRRDLFEMATAFPVSAGVSRYNADELRAAGFPDPSVVPIFVEPMRWSQPADPEWMKLLQDGRTNIVFVGRVVPNKCHQHLLEAFSEYLRFDPTARLILVGVWVEGHPYARFIRSEAERLGINHHVILTWRVTDAQLLACYRTAHLFWSMSEHEGFCVPLIEAMWCDVPVLAYRSSAIPETLGQAGLMFTEKGRWPELAALAHMLVHDRELRGKVLDAQRKRRSDFLPEAVLPSLLGLLARIGLGDVQQSGKNQPAMVDTKSAYPSMMRGQR